MKKSIKLFLRRVIVMSLFLVLLIFMGNTQAKDQFNVAVFVPGVTIGSPAYEHMVAGAEKAVEEVENATLKVHEGGFNQALWEEGIISLTATGEYDLIVSSNNAMPLISSDVAKMFPGQKYLNLDSYHHGDPPIHSVFFNQVEHAYALGYFSGLVTKSTMPGANPELKVGMIIAQQYPIMDNYIVPSFKKGLKAVDPNITLDLRVVGNWYDANKASDLAKSMIDSGIDCIGILAGSGGQGVITAAKEQGKYVVYFEAGNRYSDAPGTIIGCGVLDIEKVAYEKIKFAAQGGELPFGTAEIVNFKDGYVDFVDDDPDYKNQVSEDVRKEMGVLLHKLRSGELHFEVDISMPD